MISAGCANNNMAIVILSEDGQQFRLPKTAKFFTLIIDHLYIIDEVKVDSFRKGSLCLLQVQQR